jgi:hypothetical protein
MFSFVPGRSGRERRERATDGQKGSGELLIRDDSNCISGILSVERQVALVASKFAAVLPHAKGRKEAFPQRRRHP